MRTHQRKGKYSINHSSGSESTTATAPFDMKPDEVLGFGWLYHLEVLINRYSELGCGIGLADLSPPDVFGVYAFLWRYDHDQKQRQVELSL